MADRRRGEHRHQPTANHLGLKVSDDRHLTPDERYRIQEQVEHFIRALETRYGITAQEATDLLRWVRGQRSRNEKLAQGGALALIGLIVTALTMSMLEGIKEWFRRH